MSFALMFCSLIVFISVIITMVIMFLGMWSAMASGSVMKAFVPRLMLSGVGLFFAALRYLLFPM